MNNGSLEEMLFCKSKNRVLSWRDCIRIAIEVCSGLGFLNAAQPKPIVHCHPSPSKILLDCNLVAKITGFGLHGCSEECNDNSSDMKAIGVLLQNLLNGRRNLVTMDTEACFDEIGEQWPFDVARDVMGLAMRCMSMNCEPNGEMSITRVVEELNEIRKKGDDMVAREGWRNINGGNVHEQDSTHVPSVFICPILQVSVQVYFIYLFKVILFILKTLINKVLNFSDNFMVFSLYYRELWMNAATNHDNEHINLDLVAAIAFTNCFFKDFGVKFLFGNKIGCETILKII